MLERLGRYIILEELGEGRPGAVYRASDSLHSRYVAIRIFKEDLAGDPAFKEGLSRAARAPEHPNVAACYAVGEEGNVTYAVTELLEGKSLKTLLQEKAELSLQNKLAIMIQIADGVEHAHKNGIVHNNLRPGNIHLSPDGIIKIRDFALSGAILRDPRAYLAPERILGQASDQRADIFSAGIVFYELLTSVHPFFDPKGADPEDLLLRSDIGTVERFPQMPVGFWPIVETCLQKDPKDRYSTMGQVGAASRELLKDLEEDCELMLKELRAAKPLLKRAVEMPGSGIRLGLLLRQIERALAAGAGTDHASLQSLTLSLVEYQSHLRLVAGSMPAGVSSMMPSIPVVIPCGIQAGLPVGSVAAPAKTQPQPCSTASASASSSDDAGVSLDETDLVLDYAFTLGDGAGDASLDETNRMRQEVEVAVPEASPPSRNLEGAASPREDSAPQRPLTPFDAEKNTEKLQSQTGAGDANPLTPGPQAIEEDRFKWRIPAAVVRAAGGSWRLSQGTLRAGVVILLVLLAATLWIQVRARISYASTALGPARLSLNQKRFDEAISICQGVLLQTPWSFEAKAILEEAQNGKRQWMSDALLQEAQALRVRGRLGESRTRLRGVLELDPGNKPALRMLHQIADAEDRRGLQLKVKALVTSASALVKEGNLSRAKEQLDLAQQLLPEDQAVLATLEGWAAKSAEIFSQRQKEQQLTKAGEERVRRADELYRQGQYDEARSLLDRGPAEMAKSAETLRTRVVDAQHALKAYEADLSDQRYEEALNELLKLEKLNPADPRVAVFRQQLESEKSSGRALLTVYRLGEPGLVTLDGQRLDSGGDVESRRIAPGNHLLAVKNDRGFEASVIQEFVEGQSAVFVYDAANLLLREMRDGDQELLSKRKMVEAVHRFAVEHVHISPPGRCDGELVLSHADIEYRPRSGAHGFRTALQGVKLRAEGKRIDLYDAAEKKEFHAIETADDQQAEAVKQLWSRLENLGR